MAPGAGRLRPIAMSTAFTTSSLRRWSAMDQPTTRRLCTSSTTAKERKPAHVGTYVMSATHKRSGAGAVNSRRTRSSATGVSGLRRVMRGLLRRWHPCSPAWRRSRATRLRKHATPAWWRSAQIRGVPSVPRRCAWISQIRWLSLWSARVRAEGGRRRQALDPLRETPSKRQNTATGKFAFSASTNVNAATGSRRSLWRRRPRLF